MVKRTCGHSGHIVGMAYSKDITKSVRNIKKRDEKEQLVLVKTVAPNFALVTGTVFFGKQHRCSARRHSRPSADLVVIQGVTIRARRLRYRLVPPCVEDLGNESPGAAAARIEAQLNHCRLVVLPFAFHATTRLGRRGGTEFAARGIASLRALNPTPLRWALSVRLEMQRRSTCLRPRNCQPPS